MDGIKNNKTYEESDNDHIYFFKMIIYSIIGIVVFFIPITINNQTQIMLYHMSDKIQLNYSIFLKICVVLFVSIGSIKSYINDKNKIYLFIKFFSVLILLNIFYSTDYVFFKHDNTVLIIKEIIFNLVTVLPISAAFMPLLLEYGFLDIVESYTNPIMKKLFKISGKTIINIFIFIFTDCFVGCYLSNILYLKGKLRLNELYILLFNFSVVSFVMMQYTYLELSLNNKSFILVTIIISIISNIIMIRIYPLNKVKKSYYKKTNYKETIYRKNKFKNGVSKHLQNKENKKVFVEIIDNIEYVINLNINIIPNLVLVFFLGDLFFYNDSIISLFSKIFLPILDILKFSDVTIISKSIINSFYNNIITIDWLKLSISYNTRFIAGILLVLIGISLTTNLLYVYSTKIKINIKYLILIYLEKVILILFLYSIIYYSYRGYII